MMVLWACSSLPVSCIYIYRERQREKSCIHVIHHRFGDRETSLRGWAKHDETIQWGTPTAQDSTFFESWNSMDLSDSRSKQLDIENMKRENNGKYMNITVNHWGMTLLISPMIYPRTSHEKTGWLLAVHGYMWCMEIPAGFFCRSESKASNAKECPRQLNFGNDQSNVVQVGTS